MLIIPARAIADPNLLGRGFPPTPEGRDSWMRWRAVLKAMSGEPLNLLERSLFRAVAGRREEPARPVKFAWVIVGRRSARRQSAPRSPAPRRWATIASTCALAKRQRSSVWPMASNRPSSPSIISAAHSTPIRCWRRWWRGEYSLELNTEIEILVLANNYRSIRGRSILVAILDECCFWRSEESATPDIETYTALVPSLVTLPNSMLIGISSAYRKSGLMFEQYKQYFGVNDPDTLVIKDATREFNSTVPESFIQQELDRDPEAAAAEWLSEFRADLADYIQREVIEDAVDSDCRERPYHSGLRYVGFIDPSSGSGDSMTLAIATRKAAPMASSCSTTCASALLRSRRKTSSRNSATRSNPTGSAGSPATATPASGRANSFASATLPISSPNGQKPTSTANACRYSIRPS